MPARSMLAEKVFTANGDATPWCTPRGKFNVVALDSDGTMNAEVVLEVRFNGGTAYIVETFTENTVKVAENHDPLAEFRLRVSAFTSATAGYLGLMQ